MRLNTRKIKMLKDMSEEGKTWRLLNGVNG